MNEIKRLVEQAKYHNHDLYRAYTFIKNSKVSDFLLHVLSDDQQNDPHLLEVLDVIVERLNEQKSLLF